MVYGLQDIVLLRRMIEGSESDEARKRVERHKLNALVGLCEVTTCRRRALLSHFGEKPPDRCSNCDNCLEPIEQWDGTVQAQKILSCVYRTGERFGAVHLIDILLGHDTERIRKFGHSRLSTFAIGKELDANGWRSVVRQLVARNFLNVDVEGFGSLKLTQESRALLKGEVKLNLRKEKKPEKKPKKVRGERRGEPFAEGSKPGDKELWEALKERRAEIARDQGVPPYVIFHNTTFMEMVECRPGNLDEMRLITGVGERKLELYGDDFLKIIREHGSLPVEPPGDRAQTPTNKA
jgi:ATP-dependent DNA helicase RecQ